MNNDMETFFLQLIIVDTCYTVFLFYLK
uniref:Uncharacterized protein n=1 Tax=Tetranychus urticae TaxID=32264 RepID=T1JQ55_TETUR